MSEDLIPMDALIDGLDDDYLQREDQQLRPANNRDESLPEEVQPVNWKTLTDIEAPAVWAQLADWVDWFTARYQISVRKIPACWYRHGDLVEELSALHTAWQVSYSTLDGGYGPIGWHERLTVSMQRIATIYPSECSTSHTEPLNFTIATVTGTDGFRAWSRTSHA
jgi:hypothetical protein